VLIARGPSWDPRVMARGLSYIAERASEYDREGRLREATEAIRVVHYADGAESSVLVYDGGDGTQRGFVVNGRHEATSGAHDMRNQYLLGHLPALLHRGPVREGLVIALGSGMTAGCLARHAARVTVVELEPQVLGAAAAFAAWNHGALSDPRVRVVIDDGRHFLLTRKDRYDAITVDPIHPSVTGSESLYSLEHYALVRSRLAPGGIAAQWLPLYSMGIEDAKAITRTFAQAFPDAQLWVNGSDAILIGGAGAEHRPYAEIAAELARPEVAASLTAVRQQRLGPLLAGFAVGPPELARYVEGAALSRDDRPVLEFSLPWRTYSDTVDRNLLEIYRFLSPLQEAAFAGLGAPEREEVERSRAALGLSLIAVALRNVGHDATMRDLFERALELDPDEALALQGLGR
jgi:spermidine synthase